MQSAREDDTDEATEPRTDAGAGTNRRADESGTEPASPLTPADHTANTDADNTAERGGGGGGGDGGGLIIRPGSNGAALPSRMWVHYVGDPEEVRSPRAYPLLTLSSLRPPPPAFAPFPGPLLHLDLAQRRPPRPLPAPCRPEADILTPCAYRGRKSSSTHLPSACGRSTSSSVRPKRHSAHPRRTTTMSESDRRRRRATRATRSSLASTRSKPPCASLSGSLQLAPPHPPAVAAAAAATTPPSHTRPSSARKAPGQRRMSDQGRRRADLKREARWRGRGRR